MGIDYFFTLQNKVLYINIYMNTNSKHLEDIKVIRKIMEDSTRFFSISGLAGVFMGFFAIMGALIAKFIIPENLMTGDGYFDAFYNHPEDWRTIQLLFLDAFIVMILSIGAAFYFSIRKARKNGQALWSPISKRLLLNLAIPLITGGLFIIFTIGKIPGGITASVTLIFYGLALVNASKFTFGEIFWLGIAEIITGILCVIFSGHALLFWVFGFGILHIVYGLYMHFRYN